MSVFIFNFITMNIFLLSLVFLSLRVFVITGALYCERHRVYKIWPHATAATELGILNESNDGSFRYTSITISIILCHDTTIDIAIKYVY